MMWASSLECSLLRVLSTLSTNLIGHETQGTRCSLFLSQESHFLPREYLLAHLQVMY